MKKRRKKEEIKQGARQTHKEDRPEWAYIAKIIYDKFKVQFSFQLCLLRWCFLWFFFKLFDVLIIIHVICFYMIFLHLFCTFAYTSCDHSSLRLQSQFILMIIQHLSSISIHSGDSFNIKTTLLVLMHLPKPYIVGNLI